MSCPDRATLEAWLAEGLDLPLAGGTAAHLRDCTSCSARLLELEPALLFRGARLTPLSPLEWAPVMAAVRREVAEHPRGGGFLASLAPQLWSLLRALPAAAAVLAVVLAGWLRSAAPVAEPGGAVAASNASSFEYLSNPAAKVSSVWIHGSDSSAPVELTMIVDARISDVF